MICIFQSKLNLFKNLLQILIYSRLKTFKFTVRKIEIYSKSESKIEQSFRRYYFN